jgi:SSS family solute:Na+ symporter
VVVVVAVTYLLSLAEPRSVFPLGVWAFSGFAALFPLVAASLYWRRTSTYGAYACILTSAAVWLILFRESGYGADGGYTFHGLMPVVPMFAASVVALVAVSLVTPAPSAATVRKFFP